MPLDKIRTKKESEKEKKNCKNKGKSSVAAAVVVSRKIDSVQTEFSSLNIQADLLGLKCCVNVNLS